MTSIIKNKLNKRLLRFFFNEKNNTCFMQIIITTIIINTSHCNDTTNYYLDAGQNYNLNAKSFQTCSH